MIDFGPKRQEQECKNNAPCESKSRRGRPEKKPDYCKESMIGELIDKAVKLFKIPFDDRDERPEDAPTIVDVAEVMGISPLKVKRMLITADYYSTATSRMVQKLHSRGCSVPKIMEITGLKRASVYGYLPYSKGAYNLCDLSIGAENSKAFRERNQACAELEKQLDCKCSEIPEEAYESFWNAISTFENYLFRSEAGEGIKYTLRSPENGCVDDIQICFNGTVLTKAQVEEAFRKARETEVSEGCVCDASKLGCACAQELYAVFLRIGACTKDVDPGVLKE